MRVLLPLLLILGGCQVVALKPPAEFIKPLTNQRVIYVSESEALRQCGPKHPQNPTSVIACAKPAAKPAAKKGAPAKKAPAKKAAPRKPAPKKPAAKSKRK